MILFKMMSMFNNWLATSLKIQRSAFMSWYKLPLVYHCILATLSPKTEILGDNKTYLNTFWEIQTHFGKSKHIFGNPNMLNLERLFLGF